MTSQIAFFSVKRLLLVCECDEWPADPGHFRPELPSELRRSSSGSNSRDAICRRLPKRPLRTTQALEKVSAGRKDQVPEAHHGLHDQLLCHFQPDSNLDLSVQGGKRQIDQRAEGGQMAIHSDGFGRGQGEICPLKS